MSLSSRLHLAHLSPPVKNDPEDLTWRYLQRIEYHVRTAVQVKMWHLYASLPSGISTFTKLRKLEQHFANETLPHVLDQVLTFTSSLDESLEKIGAGESKLGVRLAVSHCRGLTLGTSANSSDGNIPSSVGHVSWVWPTLLSLPRAANVQIDDKDGNSHSIGLSHHKAIIFHRIYFMLYGHLFEEENTLNRLVLKNAPQKRRLEIHLGCEHKNLLDSTSSQIVFTKEQINAIAPIHLVEQIEGWAAAFLNDWVSEHTNTIENAAPWGENIVSTQLLEEPLSRQLQADAQIQNWRNELRALRESNPDIGAYAKEHLNIILGSHPIYEWVKNDAALEAIQALGCYRQLGGEHFYTFPTSAADTISEVSRGVPPSSLVLMTHRHLPISIQFYFSSLAQTIFEAKEALTLGLLHEETSIHRLFNAATHGMESELRTLQGEIRSGVVEKKKLSRRVEQFSGYLEHSRRLVNVLHTGKSLKVEDTDLGQQIRRAANYARLAEQDIVVRTDNLSVSRIVADADFIWLMFHNLFTNAAKHIRNPGHKVAKPFRYIEVESSISEDEQTGKKLLIRVSNGGPGLTESEAIDFFQPEADQTGLGRFIILWVVELHGGSIEADKSFCGSGRGTSFVIRLPLSCVVQEK